MNISSSINASNIYASYTMMQVNKNSNDTSQHSTIELYQFSFEFSSQSFDIQSSGVNDAFQSEYDKFQEFLQSVGYDGKPIAELTQDEATDLVSDDGFFGIQQTAERIANFVIQGSGGDETLMREGRKGILQGYDEAEAIWGGSLPEISQKTIALATQMIDDKMHELGYSIMDESA